MKRNNYLTPAIVLTLAAFSSGICLAQDLSVDWWTVDGGGDMWTAGGSLELSGTIGQPDTDGNLTMSGTTLTLTGGFWPGVETFCYGDLNGDNEVGLADLAQLLGNYGTTSGASYEDGDLDGDGNVDLGDLAELLGVYGTTCE
jgi:hypothetical protein